MTTKTNANSQTLMSPDPTTQVFSLRVVHLRWLATVMPAIAVVAYETVRHEVFDHRLHIHDLSGNLITGLVALVFCFLFSQAIFRSVEHAHRRAVEQTRAAAALTSTVEERERLSRDLHDGLAQVISYVLVRLDMVRGLVEAGAKKDAVAELESLRTAVDNVNIDVRESIAGLRSQVVQRGLLQAVGDYVAEYEERYSIRAELVAEGEPPRLSPDANLEMFRMVQEALTNTRKHARATRLTVSIANDGAELRVAVTDDGRGFDAADATASPQGIGLASMRERAAGLQGDCSVASRPGGGTTVTFTIPVGEPRW